MNKENECFIIIEELTSSSAFTLCRRLRLLEPLMIMITPVDIRTSGCRAPSPDFFFEKNFLIIILTPKLINYMIFKIITTKLTLTLQ